MPEAVELTGGGSMPTDITNDICEQLLEDQASMFDILTSEAHGNAQSAHNVVRHAAARKFNQEDPIEAAAVEMILKKT